MRDTASDEIISRIQWTHQILLDATTSLTEEQFYWRPSPTAPPIGWHLWHIGRWADRVQASLPRSDGSDSVRDPNNGIWEQEHFAADWDLEPANLGLLETGAMMDAETAARLPRQVGKERLLDYVMRAFAAANEVLDQLTSEQIVSEMESILQFKLVDGNAVRAVGKPTTVAGTLSFHVSHASRHLGMIEALRGLLDQKGTATI
jgi:hypothetical protein